MRTSVRNSSLNWQWIISWSVVMRKPKRHFLCLLRRDDLCFLLLNKQPPFTVSVLWRLQTTEDTLHCCNKGFHGVRMGLQTCHFKQSKPQFMPRLPPAAKADVFSPTTKGSRRRSLPHYTEPEESGGNLWWYLLTVTNAILLHIHTH